MTLPIAVYDSGTVFSPSVLDLTDEDVRKSFMEVGHAEYLNVKINLGVIVHDV